MGSFYLVDDSTSYSSCTYVIPRSQRLSTKKCTAYLDTIEIGPYYARNCKSNINNIVTLLNTLKHVLQPVITDLGSSTSSDAYTTFFKDIANALYVRQVFSNITNGVSVPPEPGTLSWTPILICVDGRDQVTFSEDGRQVDAYNLCRIHGQAPAMALLTTPYIVICPVFFTHPAIPIQSTASCLTVDPHRNRFAQDGKNLIKYQLWHLLHELVHYYVYATQEAHLDIYGVNACLVLRSKSALLNAQSYIYYVASEWMTPSFHRVAIPHALRSD